MRRLRIWRRRRDTEEASVPAAGSEDDIAASEQWDAPEQPADSMLDFDESGPEREYEAFVPVDAEDGYQHYGEDGDLEIPRRRLRLPRVGVRLPRLPRIRLGFTVRLSVLLAVVVLLATGILGTLLVQGAFQDDVANWWPLAVIAGGILWMLVALVRRLVSAFLTATVLVGAGVSFLLDTQAIAPADDTLFGIILVAAGLGIVIRGFLLRQRPAL